MEKPKIVIDNDVWIRQLAYPGSPSDQAIQKAEKNYTIVHSPETLAELKHKLGELEKRLGGKEVCEKFYQDVESKGEIQEKNVQQTTLKIKDPNDVMLIETAMSAGARQVISNDGKAFDDMSQTRSFYGPSGRAQDAVLVHEFQGVSVWKPEQFLDLEKSRDQQRDFIDSRNSVDALAASYAKANPESGASSGECREAAYFAHAVEDSDKYPPRDAAMRERVEQKQFEEQFEKNYRKGSGEPPREENKQELMQERMQYHMDHQNQKQFRM